MDGAAGPPAWRPTVLVVEDEALVAMLVEDTLADAGYRTVWTTDGRAGPDGAADADGVAAAVVDLRLRDGLDGRDVIRRLRARRPGLPVAVVTGYAPDAPQADLRGLGGPTLRMAKPLNTLRLAAWLRAALGAPAAPAPTPRRRRAEPLVERRLGGP